VEEEDPNVLVADDDGMDEVEDEPERRRSSPRRTAMVMVCLTSIATIPRRSLAVVSS
jgi:hypothetical protein